MKHLSLIIFFLSFSVLAQDVSIDGLCAGKNTDSKSGMKLMNLGGQDFVVMDHGFCSEYLKENSKELASLGSPINLKPEICETKDKWKLRFYTSHSFTHYFSSDLKIKSSRYNVEIKDYQWAERGSREFFTPKTMFAKGNNPFQMIDEPTNTFVVSLEKNGNEFFLSAFHPKFLQDNSQVKDMTGTIDGHPVIPHQSVNTEFYGYTFTPGESKLVRNQNTHKEMIFEVGYGKRLTLLDSRLGKINYVPSVGLGVTVGQNLTVVVQKDQWWEFEESLDKYGVQGFGGSLTNRIEFNTRNEKFGVFYENKLGFYKQKHGFLDGTQEYNLGFVGNSVGMKFMLYNPNNKKKTEAPF